MNSGFYPEDDDEDDEDDEDQEDEDEDEYDEEDDEENDEDDDGRPHAIRELEERFAPGKLGSLRHRVQWFSRSGGIHVHFPPYGHYRLVSFYHLTMDITADLFDYFHAATWPGMRSRLAHQPVDGHMTIRMNAADTTPDSMMAELSMHLWGVPYGFIVELM